MKSVIIVLSIFMSLPALAEEYHLASTTEVATCKHESGYGTYQGYGANVHQARRMASTQCFNSQVDMFENRNGRLPSDDEADMILDSCVNICP